MTQTFAHEISVPLPAAEAIMLFTPKGEEAWIEEWRPTYLEPEDGGTRAEMLFTTGTGDEWTIWTCLAWEPEQGHARYLRVTPASRVAFVDVSCRPAGSSTTVRVEYRLVPLTDAGRAFVAGMDQAGFDEMIDGWAALIAAHLATRG